MSRTSRAPLVLASALGCALTSGCYLAHERGGDAAVADAASACVMAPSAGCTSWEPVGPLTRISEPLRAAETVRYGSTVVRDCGVLVAWGIASSRGADISVRYETRTADWSGMTLGAVVAHPALTIDGSSATAPELARGPDGVGGLVGSSAGCVFVPLDVEGRERGAPVAETRGGTCGGIAGSSSGYSFMAQSGRGSAYLLMSLNTTGTMGSFVTLPVAPERSLWSRTTFDDGSFLAYSFTQDFATSRYTGWLQHFDERGRELAPEVELGENGVPVIASPTARGAVAVWTSVGPGGTPLRIRPIDRDGSATGETRDAPAEGALYGFTMAATPDGDVALAWVEWHSGAVGEWRMRVLALGPDGTPRGAPVTALTTDAAMRTPQLLVEPSGGRALLVFDDETGVRAQALSCVR